MIMANGVKCKIRTGCGFYKINGTKNSVQVTMYITKRANMQIQRYHISLISLRKRLKHWWLISLVSQPAVMNTGLNKGSFLSPEDQIRIKHK